MEVGEGTTGAVKRPVRINDVGLRGFAQSLSADRNLPEAVDGAACEPPPEEDPKLKRLAVLWALRERDIISDRAFLLQRRLLQRAALPSIPMPSPLAAPPSPEKPHGWWKLLGIALLILAGLGIIGLKAFKPANRGEAAGDLVAELTAEVDSNPENVYALGKAFRLGLYTYTIAGYQTAATLGGQFNPVSAGEGAKYVVVTFTIRNDSIRARAVSTEDFKLQDASGMAYRPSSEATAVLRIPLDRRDMWLTDLEPGTTKVLGTAFEVPAASLKRPLKLIIPEQGPLASREAIVRLKF